MIPIDESPNAVLEATARPAVRTCGVNAEYSVLPVSRPRLPFAHEILPFLEFIDTKCWYSNHGSLVTLLETKLSQRLGCDGPVAVTAASATAGLTATLLALQIPAGSLCVVPSWTFAATPHAARAAGLVPFFCDVDRETWALNPQQVKEELSCRSLPVGAVLAVSPFGAPLNLDEWEAFEEQTGVPVIIDAAAGFDSLRPSRIPSVVSLHATKILAAGEGGFIVSTDARLLGRIRACSNFGFSGSRTALWPAVNSKMSEYHAAVALADLYRWHGTRRKQGLIHSWYRNALEDLDDVSLQPGYGDGWVSATTNIVLAQDVVPQVAHELLQRGVETRSWWGRGCHVQPAFADCPRANLSITEDFASRVLGLPHFTDMQEEDVYRVRGALAAACS